MKESKCLECGYDFQRRSDENGISFPDESLTRQEFVSQVNINNILKKYVQNGVDPFVISEDARYGDFTNIPSYQEALDLVNAAEEHFLSLPVQIRNRFDNDPALLLEFLGDVSNRDEAISLGLVQDMTIKPEKISPAAPVSTAPVGGSES